MKLSLCTITFRHHLISLEEIARWAVRNEFQGVELWAAHARNLAQRPDYNAAWLASFGLTVPMVSDYLPLEGNRETLRRATADLCRLANRWGARKIRTFAGNQASSVATQETRQLLSERLHDVCSIAEDHGIALLVETHPGTLADNQASTLDLIEDVNHPALKLNFDTLHVWEGGDDPVAAYRVMRPHIQHFHLKNVRDRADLDIFEPANVYAAAGNRQGMTPLFEGALDYADFLDEIMDDPDAEASLEWFGGDCFDVLSHDAANIRRVAASRNAPLRTGTF